MADFETVEGSVDVDSTVDPLYSKQKEGVARMRTSLLAFDGSSGSARQALNNITVLRMYHQVARVIRYIEMMDKIEDKMYQAIDRTVDNANPNTPGTWMMRCSKGLGLACAGPAPDTERGCPRFAWASSS